MLSRAFILILRLTFRMNKTIMILGYSSIYRGASMAYDPTKTRRITFDMTEEMYQRLLVLKANRGKKIMSELMRDIVDEATPKAKKGR